MKILEILLSQPAEDKSISPKHAKKLDALKKKMGDYVDKICNPATSDKGREFLKAKLKDQYNELRDTIKEITEAEEPSTQKYEVFDTKTGAIAGGPYSSMKRARTAVDRLDNKYGGYRYRARPIPDKKLSEAVHRLPLSHEDFDLVEELMSRPIPAAIAPIYIQSLIEDDELTDQLMSLEETEPNRDVRPIIAEWFRRVMPDQMYRFNQDKSSTQQKAGLLSPIHGYDTGVHQCENSPITGDAYGSR